MKKRGFTLIELLAVIVILAIIAIIAVPSVLNIIEDSKKSAVEESGRNIARAAETYYMQGVMKGETPDSIDLTTNTLNYSGDKPEKGLLTYDETGRAYIKMYMNGYCVLVDYDNTVSSEKVDKSECILNAVILSFNANGGEASETSREYDSGNELGELPTPSKTGYTFNGWLLQDGTIVTSATKINESMTITASWKANQYSVTLSDGDDTTIDNTIVVTYDNAYGEMPEPTKEGYRFSGWKLEDGTTIKSTSIVLTASNHTLYAQWTKKTYNLNLLLLTATGNEGALSMSLDTSEYAFITSVTYDIYKENKTTGEKISVQKLQTSSWYNTIQSSTVYNILNDLNNGYVYVVYVYDQDNNFLVSKEVSKVTVVV